MKIETWFPVSVACIHLSDHDQRITSQKVMQWLEENASANVPYSEVENLRTSFHKRIDIIEAAQLTELRSAILSNAGSYMHAINGSLPPVRINSWINIFDQGSSEESHTHYGSVLSGCYYVSCPPDGGQFVIQDPIQVRRMWYEHSGFGDRNEFSYDYVSYQPRPGMMLIFQPWMEHGVNKHRSKEQRISVAFNLVA